MSGYWRDRTVDYIVSRPGDWLALMARKFALLWNATEVVDTEAQDTYAEWSWPLRVLGPITHFGLLVPLAAAGLLLSWRDDERLFVLDLLAAAYGASVLVFYVFARYRYPLVPFLVLFASGLLPWFAGVTAAGGGVAVRRPPSPLAYARAGLIVVLIVFCNWRLIPREWMRAVSESNIGVALQAEARYDAAIVHYQRAIAARPDYAPALNNLASAYRAAGRVDEAIAVYRRAIALQPDFPDAEYNLANALLEKGATDEAVGRFEVALRSIPGSPDVHNNLGTALAAKGRVDDAIREFQKALALDPGSAAAHRNLGDLLAASGDRAGALEHLRLAVAADPAMATPITISGWRCWTPAAPGRSDRRIRAAVERPPACRGSQQPRHRARQPGPLRRSHR